MSENEADLDTHVTPADPLVLAPTSSNGELEKKPNCLSRFAGIFYTLAASFLFTSSTFLVKQLEVDLLDAFLVRFFVHILIILAFASYKKYALFGSTPREVFMQAVCAVTGASTFVLYSLALRYVELPDLNTLGYTRVVWTVVLSVIVYRERPSMGTLIALPLTLLGVVFVTQPTFLFKSAVNEPTRNVDSKLRVLGFMLALTCALLSSINVLMFKKLISISRDIKPSILTFHSSTAMLLLLIANQLYKIFYQQVPVSTDDFLNRRYILASAVCLITIVGSVMVQKAIKREHPAVFSLLGSAEIICALILQNLFTNVRSNLYALFGSALVIFSVVILGVSRILNERQSARKASANVEKC